MKKEVMKNITSRFMSKLKEQAKDESYADSMEMVKIVGSQDLAVIVSEVASEIGKVTQAVYYYRAQNKTVETSQTYQILKRYEPYLKELLPLKPDKRFKLIFKKISQAEMETFASEQAIARYLHQVLPALRNGLLGAGENPANLLTRDKVDPASLVFEDLSFTVLRKELGLRQEADPVWIPSLRDTHEQGIIKGVLKEADKILEGKKKYIAIERRLDKITFDEANEIGEFEKKIFNKV